MPAPWRPVEADIGRPGGEADDRAPGLGYCLAAMLHINDLTYRIEGRVIFDGATAGIPAGHKVGLVGRNGAGKTTLLRLIAGELAPDDGGINVPRATRIGWVAQEAPGGPEQPDRLRAGRRQGARRGCWPRRRRRTIPRRIADIHERLADIGAHAAPARAARILAGLGFDEAAQQRPCAEFSGGWRMRVALAAMLFTEPDLLLLDEPTNYLDLEGTLWLEDYLRDYPHTVLIVSHDRDLLNRSVTSILHLAQGKLTLYTGGYDQFEETRREKQRLDLKLKKKQDDERRHIEAFIARFKAKASKATQAQSRVKALARMQPIAEQIEERVAPFLLPNPAKAFASPLIRLEGAAAGYAPDAAGAAGARPAPRRRRPRRPARRQRQRQEHLRQADRRPHGADGRAPLRLRQDRGRLFRPAPDGRPARRQDALRAHARADARRHRGAAARAARHARLRHRQGRHQGREPVGRREGAAAVRAGHLPRRRTC